MLSALVAPAAVAGELTVSTLAVTQLVRGGLDTLPTGPVAALAHGVTQSMFRTHFNLLGGILSVGLALGIATGFLMASPTNSPADTPTLSPLPRIATVPITTQAPKPAAPVWRERATFMHTATVTALAIGPSDILFAGDGDDNVIAWNIREEKKVRTIIDGTKARRGGAIDLLALHPDGTWLYIVNQNHLIQMNLEKKLARDEAA